MAALKDRGSKHLRAVRATLAVRSDARAANGERLGPTRSRRGHLGELAIAWRRCSPGTNHIANLGVWRVGARRQAERVNRTGATHWQMRRRDVKAAEPMQSATLP